MEYLEWSDLASFNPGSATGFGGTGNLPVPLGHWPDGTAKNVVMETAVRKNSGAPFNPIGASPLYTVQ